jgi:hypothetical protein
MMTTIANEKRLTKIEERLTPKEWGILLADEVTKYPALDDFCIAEMKSDTSLPHKAQAVLLEQAEARYPGPKLRDQRRWEIKAVQTEFDSLKQLVFKVNEAMRTRLDKAAVEVTLKLQALQTIILQDAIRETATTASEWIEGQKTTGKATDARKAILDALAAHRSDEEGEDCPSSAEMWAETTRALAVDLARHKAAVAYLQDTYFDGHGMLARDIEADLNGLIQTVAEAIRQHNEYLTVRGKPADRLRIAPDDLTPPPTLAKALADNWLQEARDKAILDVLNWMDDSAGRDAYRREMVKRMIGDDD